MDISETRKTVHQGLLKARDRLLQKRGLERRLAEAEESLRSQKESVRALEAQWRRESADVKRIEGLSVIALVTSVMGTKEQRIKKERQEMAAAQLKLEAGREVYAKLESECDGLAYDLKGLEGAQQEYDSALAAKERILRDSGEAGRLLAGLAEDEAQHQNRAREIQEAIKAGNAAETFLAQVVDSMQRASNWGTWDLLGGGWIATGMKHSRLDDAKGAAIAAQSALHRFKRELADVGRDLVTSIEIGEFSRFADYFFDGIIIDWSVQSKISTALARAEGASRQVSVLLRHLESDLDRCRQQEIELRARRRELIERA